MGPLSQRTALIPRGMIAVAAIVVWVALAIPTGASADEPAVAEADRTAIEAVIRHQLDAFQRDDSREAFSYASPGIQARFGTAEIFLEMVREAYAPVYRPRQVQFMDLQIVRGLPVQRVFVVGPANQRWFAFYPMHLDTEGNWRIDGCYLLPIEGSST